MVIDHHGHARGPSVKNVDKMQRKWILKKDSADIKFYWTNYLTLLSLYPFIGTFMMTILSVKWFLKHATLLRILRINFFGSTWIICILFINLAKKWSKISQKWINLEHTLALSNALEQSCTFDDMLRNLCFQWFPQVFSLITFTPKIGILVLSVNAVSTFIFNFIDVFIIINGYILCQLYHQFNLKLKTMDQKVQFYWQINHRNYNIIRELANLITESLSTLLFISFIQSIITICFQLYFNLTPDERSLIGKIYYVLSLSYLIIRSTSLCIVLGWVAEESSKAKEKLFSVQYVSYTSTIERFENELACQHHTYFNGLGFFIVTRKTIIMIMSIIITYQVMMQQFNYAMTDPEDGQASISNSKNCSNYKLSSVPT
ncbi:gustatory receptor for sugar taste 64f-like [Lycorma delicatula]|uniref:gustatory receptor for sugar taste 64f-like n=1 Tax=Lycorma delicatula TaxID=130591 RepID=UPI003F517B41